MRVHSRGSNDDDDDDDDNDDAVVAVVVVLVVVVVVVVDKDAVDDVGSTMVAESRMTPSTVDTQPGFPSLRYLFESCIGLTYHTNSDPGLAKTNATTGTGLLATGSYANIGPTFGYVCVCVVCSLE
jgi:hypothetical protein